MIDMSTSFFFFSVLYTYKLYLILYDISRSLQSFVSFTIVTVVLHTSHRGQGIISLYIHPWTSSLIYIHLDIFLFIKDQHKGKSPRERKIFLLIFHVRRTHWRRVDMSIILARDIFYNTKYMDRIRTCHSLEYVVDHSNRLALNIHRLEMKKKQRFYEKKKKHLYNPYRRPRQSIQDIVSSEFQQLYHDQQHRIPTQSQTIM